MPPIVLDFVAHNARVTPHALAITELSTGQTWTHSALDADVRRAEAVLKDRLKTPEGQRVAFLGRNSAAVLIVQFACVRIGAVFVPLNWRLTPTEIADLIADCEPSLIIVDDIFDGFLSEQSPVAKLRRGTEHDELAEAMAQVSVRHLGDGVAVAPERPITLLYSSGTTGKPKGVIITALNGFSGALGLAIGVRMSAATRLLLDMPMFHTAGLFGSCWGPLIMGGSLLISQKFDAETTYARLSSPHLGVTHYFSVTQMAQMLRQLPGFHGPAMAHLTAYITGGAPNPIEHHRAWLDDGVMMLNAYGMSETGSATASPIGDLRLIHDKAGHVGVPHLSVELKIAAPDGQVQPPGEIGEIWARGATVTPGYWRQPDLNAKAFEDGWFKTSDVGFCDQDGSFMLVDRLKDMYISGGENVYPAEIEAAILAMPGVIDAAVISMPHPKWGEMGLACVVVGPETVVNEEAVLAHCRDRLAGFKIPKRVLFLNTLDRTASGKVQKHLLRQRIQASTST